MTIIGHDMLSDLKINPDQILTLMAPVQVLHQDLDCHLLLLKIKEAIDGIIT